MNLTSKIIAVLGIGAGLGIAVTWLSVGRGDLPNAVTDGPWQTSTAIGSPQSDPYTRASVALHGLFALNRNETLYYTATRDSDGNALSGNCEYDISGGDPNTRWWSITVYGSDDYLIANPGNIYSVDKSNVARSPDGAFSVQIGGPSRKQANWIPTESGAFSLILRLYDPGPDTALDPQDAVLPAIVKGACQ